MSKLMMLGAGSSASAPAIYTKTTGASASSAAAQTTYTFNSVTLDADVPYRIVAVYGGNNGTASRTISSVTVDGQTATQLVFNEAINGATVRQSALFIAPGTANSSGSVVVTWSAAGQSMCAIHCGSVTGTLLSTTPTNTYTDSGTTLSQSINVTAGGFFVAAVFGINNVTCTWLAGAADPEQFDTTSGLNRCYTKAAANYTSAQTGLTVSATLVTTNNADVMVIAALR
jgi:hypothetical protein